MTKHKLVKKKNFYGGMGYNLSLNNLTLGEVMALTRALRYYDSPVGNDVLGYVLNTIYESGDEKLKIEIASSLEQLVEKMKAQPVTA